ncbi:hypothetical protein CHU92_07080 [Flavobacterium cyanobacteriorum]|uniref:Glycosyl transferase family 28 C-terminal domain-containing protein n=1 Tax=Flavobacterium cyanobacteriorum TaxID=2022802 RepID=A0A255Z966_9FLAO|nr:glycosyltransferase [Flavobacterium cyanobacteriorum]OYQ37979.1 hypothetical protein CHU92_07080 [Flavobacterium cyanobacteriorum]
MKHYNKPLLLVFPFGLLSHYLRCLVLARHLSPYFRIRFAYHKDYAPFIQAEGFGTFDCITFDEKEVIAKARKFDFSWLSDDAVGSCFLAQADVIERLGPVAVLGDAMPTLKLAAEKTGVPYISVLNGYMTRYYGHVRKLSRSHMAYPYLEKLPRRIKEVFTEMGESMAFREIHRPFKKLRLKYNLSRHDNYLDEMEGDYNIICDMETLFPLRDLPQNYYIPGPILYTGHNNDNNIKEQLNPQKKTIFVSMGSSGEWQKVAFLNHPEYDVYNIITAGDTHGVLKGPHIINTPFADADSLFPHVDLVLCHGGNGTVYQALSHGIPLLCKTSHFEQEWNVAALEKKGLAKSLDRVDKNTYTAIIAEWVTKKGTGAFSAIKTAISHKKELFEATAGQLARTVLAEHKGKVSGQASALKVLELHS